MARFSSNSSAKKVRVLAFGTFDFFHAGHIDYLRQAKALGDELIVVIARDETVKKVKGRAPTHSEKVRMQAVKACTHVDKVVLGYLGDKYRVLKDYKPDVIALGYDQFAFTYKLQPFLIKEKMSTRIVRLEPFHPQSFKSSLMRKQHEESQCAPHLAST